jgi:hypothetical protein
MYGQAGLQDAEIASPFGTAATIIEANGGAKRSGVAVSSEPMESPWSISKRCWLRSTNGASFAVVTGASANLPGGTTTQRCFCNIYLSITTMRPAASEACFATGVIAPSLFFAKI